MGKTIMGAIVSLDGYIADDSDGVGPLFDWGGNGDVSWSFEGSDDQFRTTQASADFMRARYAGVAAVVIGRRLFDLTNGWDGKPAAGEHVFVVTHEPPKDWEHAGTAPFTFVDGVEAAIGAAREFAGDRIVDVAAGQIGGQALRLGLIDQVVVNLVPVVFGSGRPFFATGSLGSPILLDNPSQVVRGDRVTHLVYDVVRTEDPPVKIDLFNEIQNPRPWPEGHEQHRFRQAIEQAKVADELGYGCWWQVEHHGAGEFSLSSAPELLLAAIAQHTSRIRLGHSAVLAPSRFNHPIRVAERAATLDHLSGGRVELGLTRSTIPEWRLFNIEPDDARAQTQQAFEMVPKMWTSDRFSYHSDTYQIDDVSIGPKPLQKPHPPLWQAAASPSSFEDAGRRGVGVLGTTMWESLERAGRMVNMYRAAAEQCTDPVGAFVNNQVAYFTFVHCADTDEEAMRNGAAAAAAWYTVTALTFFEAAAEFARTMRRHQELLDAPDGGGLTGQFLRGEAGNAPTEAQLLIGRVLQGEQVADEEIFTVLSAQDSLIVGSQETCRKKLRAYADLGIDRMMCLQQIGSIPDDKVMKSIRLIGELIPDLDRG